MSKTQKAASLESMNLPVIHPLAAGIDVGARFHAIATSQEEEDTFESGTTTPDLHQMAQRLKSAGVKTVAMESTGYYWVPIAVLLKDYGFEVLVVNPRSIKQFNRPKTDRHDARWIQKLHALGLLRPSFQLGNYNESLRCFSRRRRSLIEDHAQCMNRMHKVLVLMNVQIGLLLSDLNCRSGLEVVRAIVEGQRDPQKLYACIRSGVKASKAEFIKALSGTWQAQYVFELKQLWSSYLFIQAQIKECDEQIDQQIAAYCQEQGIPLAEKKKDRGGSIGRHNPAQTTVDNLQSIIQTDLLSIGGVGGNFILEVLCEVGFTLEQFPSAKHFASWLGLAPNTRISGGKLLSSKVPKRRSNAARAFRLVANSIGNCNQHPLKSFFMAKLRKLGRRGAIVATARKLATIVYHMITQKVDFKYQLTEEIVKKQRLNQLKKIQKTILQYSFSPEELAVL